MKNKFNINDEVYFLTTNNIHKCPDCNGEYRVSLHGNKIHCKTCKGKGVVTDDKVEFTVSDVKKPISKICLCGDRIIYELSGNEGEDGEFSDDTIAFIPEELIGKLKKVNETWSYA